MPDQRVQTGRVNLLVSAGDRLLEPRTVTHIADELFGSSRSGGTTVIQTVTVIMGIVVGLTFLFGFGNVLNLALRLGGMSNGGRRGGHEDLPRGGPLSPASHGRCGRDRNGWP
jgi:hypothetical protein